MTEGSRVERAGEDCREENAAGRRWLCVRLREGSCVKEDKSMRRGKLREGGQIHETREAQWRSKLWRRTDDGSTVEEAKQWRRTDDGSNSGGGDSGGGQIGLIIFWIMNINYNNVF
jgi:hypothetical protein